MMKKFLMVAAAFASVAVAGAMPIAPAAAQPGFAPPNVCLRSNRIYSWDVVNPNTMIVSDRQRNRYMVRLSGGCWGLQENLFRVAFRTSTRLGCLRPGDRVEYRAPGWGRDTCFIRSVQPLNTPPRPGYGNDWNRPYNVPQYRY